MDRRCEEELAGWLAEAFETGNALVPVPASHLPPDMRAGEHVAIAVLERLGMTACGVRVASGPEGERMAGPMLEGRLVASQRPVALVALRHARASAAVVAVLAEPLSETGAGHPAIAALHPAIDIAACRLRDPPATASLLAADLGGLGQVVVGRRREVPAEDVLGALPITLAAAGRRPRPRPMDLVQGLERAACTARRLGGLPAGAVLVVAGLSAPVQPQPGEVLAAGLGPLGRVRARFA